MKRRIHRAINFFAFNLLFFSLYLNFIHHDQAAPVAGKPATGAVSLSRTMPVDHPEKYIDSKTANEERAVSGAAAGTAKVSIN